MSFNLSQELEKRYGKPHLSYSSIKQAIDDMAIFDAYMRKEITFKSDALDFGTMYDMLLFERDKALETYFILGHEYVMERCPESVHKAKSPKATDAYKATKAAIEQELEEQGRKLCSADDWKMANDMIDRLHTCGLYRDYLTGDYQKPVMKEIDGVLIKGFIDCRTQDFIVDSKSTRSVTGFRYDVRSLSYDIQAYLYTQAEGCNSFYWVAQEKTFPYTPALVKCSEETLFNGEMKFKSAIHKINQWLSKEADLREDFLSYEV